MGAEGHLGESHSHCTAGSSSSRSGTCRASSATLHSNTVNADIIPALCLSTLHCTACRGLYICGPLPAHLPLHPGAQMPGAPSAAAAATEAAAAAAAGQKQRQQQQQGQVMAEWMKIAAADTPAALLPAVINLPQCGLCPTLPAAVHTVLQWCRHSDLPTLWRLQAQAGTHSSRAAPTKRCAAADRLCFQPAPRAPWAAWLVGFRRGVNNAVGTSTARGCLCCLCLPRSGFILHPPTPVCQSLPAQMAQRLPPSLTAVAVSLYCCFSSGSCYRPSSSQQQQQSAAAPAQQQQQQYRLAAAH